MSVELFAVAQELLSKRDVPKALDFFHSAQGLGYAAEECAAGRWKCWMLLGQFEEAWQESDFISSKANDSDSGQFWKGESWNERRVMLRCLHGLGDTIQFIRYALLLKETCRCLTVQTHPELVRLIQGVVGVDHVFTWGGGVSADSMEWDVQLEITELPRAFRTQPDQIPASIPYIQVPSERIQWASTFLNDSRSLRVGIIWQAGPFDGSRSLALSQLADLLSHPNCQFYSLQKNVVPEVLELYPSLCNLAAHASDVQDTAALMLNLDLVITVDTMTAHLAGALGCPVWIMLPASADWRWMLERVDTPWYPTARLFRQDRQGEWGRLIARIDCELGKLSNRLYRSQIVFDQENNSHPYTPKRP